MYIVEHIVSVWSHKLARPPVLCKMHFTGYMTLGSLDLGIFFGQSGLFKDKFKAIVAAERERASGVHRAFMSHKVDCALTCYPLLCDGAKCAR